MVVRSTSTTMRIRWTAWRRVEQIFAVDSEGADGSSLEVTRRMVGSMVHEEMRSIRTGMGELWVGVVVDEVDD